MATAIPARRSGVSSGNRRTLIIAIVFGLLAAFLVYRAVSSSSGSSSGGGDVSVLVARQDIPARTVLTDGMLTLEHVPAKLKLASALSDTKVTTGKIARTQIAAGEQVLATRLAGSVNELGFAGQVPDGLRAVSILANEVSVTGGLIQPGDFVDVIATFNVNDKGPDVDVFASKPDGGAAGRVMSGTLLQSVQVLAIAQDAVTPGSNNAPSGGKVPAAKGNAEARSVTLAVSEDDAARLALADEMGTLRLALRHVNDNAAQPPAQVDNSFPSLFANGGQVHTIDSGTTPAAAPSATPQH